MTDKHIRVGVFAPPHHSNDENPTLAMQRDFQLVEWLDELGYSEYWLGEHHSGGMQIYGSPELFIAAAAERTDAHQARRGRHLPALPQPADGGRSDRAARSPDPRAGHVRLRPGRAVLRCAHAEHPRRQVARSHAAGGAHHRETDRWRDRDGTDRLVLARRMRAFTWNRTRARARIWPSRASRRRRAR